MLFVDPYIDFLAEGDEHWPRIAEIAKAVGLQENLRAVPDNPDLWKREIYCAGMKEDGWVQQSGMVDLWVKQ